MVAFATVLTLTPIVGLFSISQIAKVNLATADIAANWLVATRALGDYRSALNVMGRAESQHVLAFTPEEFASEEDRIAKAKAGAAAAWKRYRANPAGDDEKKLIAEVEDRQRRYFEIHASLLPLSRGADAQTQATRNLFKGDSRASFAALMGSIEQDLDLQGKGAEAAYRASQDTYASTRTAVIGLLLGALAIGAFLARLITRSITGPIASAVRVAETVAAGDLSADAQVRGSDETGQLLQALKRMDDSLVHEAGRSMGDIVAQVRRVNDQIGEISAASTEQSTRIGQIGDAVNQLDQVTQQNAALVEESAAAESLKLQAAQLAGVVSVFNLGADRIRSLPAPAV